MNVVVEERDFTKTSKGKQTLEMDDFEHCVLHPLTHQLNTEGTEARE
jgi:hypothetical protein